MFWALFLTFFGQGAVLLGAAALAVGLVGLRSARWRPRLEALPARRLVHGLLAAFLVLAAAAAVYAHYGESAVRRRLVREPEPPPATLAEADGRVARDRRRAAADALYRGDLAVSLSDQAVLLGRAKRWPEAAAAQREAVALWRPLAAASPDITFFAVGLGLGLCHLAEATYRAGGSEDEAVALAREAEAVLEPLSRKDPATYRISWETAAQQRRMLELMRAAK